MVGWLQMFGSGITSKASGPSRYETNPSVAAGGGAWLKIVSSEAFPNYCELPTFQDEMWISIE
ncbi:hypothetical protein T4E_5769 [Trichinella pseudospiralis]|uniref:Uncharacterized protein n=1 Tax=Trichinella pseudospiralis TaxID=6337 RepID=A0A0V0XL05_TRIPS|nr:hypothetical protein T4E_5769 [Trichinella pseudospiralis]